MNINNIDTIHKIIKEMSLEYCLRHGHKTLYIFLERTLVGILNIILEKHPDTLQEIIDDIESNTPNI